MAPADRPALVISRTDAIGDVVLTLPLAGLLRRHRPDARIVFVGRRYTQPVIAACRHVDTFVDWDELAAQPPAARLAAFRALQASAVLHVFPRRPLASLARAAGVPVRVGTRSRWYHWWTCNRRVALARRNSDRHEAWLNVDLAVQAGLLPATVLAEPSLVPFYGLAAAPGWPAPVAALASARGAGRDWVLHAGSHQSARNWPLGHFVALARALRDRGDRVFLTGTAAEGAALRPAFAALMDGVTVVDVTGQLTLPELMQLLAMSAGAVAASTGPLHLAAALGRIAVGIYPPVRPMHATRWGPLGSRAVALAHARPGCRDCRERGAACACMAAVAPGRVLAALSAAGAGPGTPSGPAAA